MSDFDQKPYTPLSAREEADLFVDNPDPRCPVVLLLDRSGSMTGEPLRELNAGLRTFAEEVGKDALAARRVEVAVVSFGPVTADVDFATVDRFVPPALDAGGDTPTGRAIEVALEMLARRKETFRQNGISYFRPWVFLITDGRPTDAWQEAARRVHAEERQKRLAFFAVGVRGADFATLAQIAVREPLRLDGLKFRELFLWLSRSLSSVSRSQVGTEVALPSPRGWASV